MGDGEMEGVGIAMRQAWGAELLVSLYMFLIRFVFNYHSGFCVENQKDGRLVRERT